MSLKFKNISTYNNISNIQINTPADTVCIFHGKILDERGIAIIEYFESSSINKSINLISYTQDNNSFTINDRATKSRKVQEELDKYCSLYNYIVLDSTTLSYVEILVLLYAINNSKNQISIDIYYIEPIEYAKESENLQDINFSLTEESGNLAYIKPFYLDIPQDSINKDETSLIIFLGFESNRLENILDNDNEDYKYNKIFPVLAVPAFEYGWENISLVKHYKLIDGESLKYVPADNPYATYKFLDYMVENSKSKQIVIMPFGTKPNTIGSAIFLVNNKERNLQQPSSHDVATKYDFPIKSHKRTEGIRIIHKYALVNF